MFASAFHQRSLSRALPLSRFYVSSFHMKTQLTIVKTAIGAGIDDYKVILDDQYVEVTGTIPLDELTKRIEKTGKEVSSSSANFFLRGFAVLLIVPFEYHVTPF